MPRFDHHNGIAVEIAGAHIYAESQGPADAPVLVLLHGGLGNLEDFNALAADLHDWRLVASDSRGHGKSTLGHAPWTYERVQEDVAAVLGQLGVRRCSVLGFSDGGIVGLRLAANARVAIDKLAVVGATWHHKNLAATRPLLQKVTAQSWKAKFPATFDAYQRLNPEPDFERLVPAVVQGWLDESASGHPDDSVARIPCPVLVARGDDDHLTMLADAVELRGRLPHAHLLNIPFAGHVAYDDGRAMFLPALRQFLAG